MFGDATSQLLATMVLPVAAGFICLFVVMLQSPPRLKHEPVRISEAFPRETLGVMSIADAYDPSCNMLWETQILVLQRIAAHATVAELYTLWERYVRLYPELYEQISFWKWLTFLQNCNLAESDSSVVRLTANGRDFLKLLTQNANQSQHKRAVRGQY